MIAQQVIEQRIRELEAASANGQQQLETLEQRRQELAQKMLRIAGAIQVLEELKAGHPELGMEAGSAASGD